MFKQELKLKQIFLSRHSIFLLLIVFVVAFGVLRFQAALNDFYIDEIWSFYFARQSGSPLDVFTLQHDNNHILNTLFLYYAGGDPSFFIGKPNFIWYRLFSVASGTVSLWLLCSIAMRRGRLEAFTVTWLAGLSYPLIIYSSEARGYAPAILFALLSYVLIQTYWNRPRFAPLFFFWISIVLGFLSHSSFVYVYLALLVWSIVKESGTGKNFSGTVKEIAKCHIIPLIFTSAFYFFFLKGIVIGGGEVSDLRSELPLMASMITGLPANGFYGALAIALILFFSFLGLRSLKKQGSNQWVFYFCVIFITPIFTMAIMRPEFIYFRYFLVVFPFLYLLIAHIIASLYRRSRLGASAYIIILIIFSILNLNSIWRLLVQGRGQYFDAVKFITSNSQENEILIGSDHDFRNKIVLGFYAAYIKGKKIVYIDEDKKALSAPEWLIMHSVTEGYAPNDQIFDSGFRYILQKSYSHAGPSGWSWFVYRKEPDDNSVYSSL